MKRGRCSDDQIIDIVTEQEAGMTTAEVCRRHVIRGATFYRWKAKYGGMEVSEAKRLLSDALLHVAVSKDTTARYADAGRNAEFSRL